MADPYSKLGAVTGNTRRKAVEVTEALRKATGKHLAVIWGKDSNPRNTEHYSGRALDLMLYIGAGGSIDTPAGDWLADYLWANRARLGVSWILWRRRFKSVSAGRYGPAGQWNQMEDRGNPTNNHMDHVHVYFGSDSYAAPTGGTITPPPAQTVWREGDSGPKVREIQKIVGVTVDGTWGPNTTAAVKRWQASKGLAADGEWGPACEAASKPKPPTPPTPKPPTPDPKGDPMASRLVRLTGTDPVYLSLGQVFRRWVKDPAELKAVQDELRSLGQPAEVKVVKTLAPYGVDVTDWDPTGGAK